jgi:glucose-6-phosphate dehydrogenase assembly protein OpcA
MENTVTTPRARARTATLIAVGPAARLGDVAAVLGTEEDIDALHIVRILTDGEETAPDAPTDIMTIGGLRPEYVNNAIAGVRLSGLPTVVWWRGGQPEGLDGVAALADRVILDAEDPWELWVRTPDLFEHTALTDIRWAALTRWRAALAHFFDLPEIRASAASFSKLAIAAADRSEAALFAGWVDSSLGWNGKVRPVFQPSSANLPMESVSLGSPSAELRLDLLPNSTCLSAEARVSKEVLASRVVSIGDQSLSTLLAEELRVRSRDVAFERAVTRAIAKR